MSAFGYWIGGPRCPCDGCRNTLTRIVEVILATVCRVAGHRMAPTQTLGGRFCVRCLHIDADGSS